MITKARYPGIYFGEGVRWQSYRLSYRRYGYRDGRFRFFKTVKPYFYVAGHIPIAFYTQNDPIPRHKMNREIHYERCL